jgi:hypothetical protein
MALLRGTVSQLPTLLYPSSGSTLSKRKMHRFKNTSLIRNFIFFFIALTFLFISCGKSLPTLEGVDLQLWKEDKNGCSRKRSAMQEAIVAQKDKLLALGELQVAELLGKPDQNELYKRNQKFFYYYLQPAKECNAGDTLAPKRLSIRFNAMGLAKEIRVE